MIVKNEARNLEASIAPVQELVDEIVVVDTGSTDDTVAIAERLGAKVFHFAWCDSFAAARNAAIEHATGDWIFVLDADDRMVPSEVAKLRALFTKLDDENVGYLMGTCACRPTAASASRPSKCGSFRDARIFAGGTEPTSKSWSICWRRAGTASRQGFASFTSASKIPRS